MADQTEELLNVYDAQGRVVGRERRARAKAAGARVGAVNALILGPDGRVLLQQRPADKENGGLWDKSVGGHVSAGEDFDTTVLREAGEELFEDGQAPRVRLVSGAQDARGDADVLLWRAGLQLNLRDVRRLPAGGFVNVLYHVAMYLGRTRLPIEGFRPQRTELQGLGYFAPAEVDLLLLRGKLAPNMAFLWLSQAQALLSE